MRSSLRLSKVSETPKIWKMEKVLKVQLAWSMQLTIDGSSSSTTNLTYRASSGSILKRLKPSFIEWLRWLLRLLFVLTAWNPVQWLKGIETYWNHLEKNHLGRVGLVPPDLAQGWDQPCCRFARSSDCLLMLGPCVLIHVFACCCDSLSWDVTNFAP